MRRLFLTGPMGCGKSTTIEEALGHRLPRCGGFRTRRGALREGRPVNFLLESPDGSAREVFLDFSSGKPRVHLEVFAGLGVRLLRGEVLVLAGIMVSSLFQSGTSFIKLAADPNNQLPQITFWLMGSLSGARWREIGFVILPMLAGLILLLLLRWQLNVITMGDDEAWAMGVNAPRIRLVIVLCSTLVTASAVSVSGMIGWVGLVIPHMLRRVVGSDYRWLLPASMLGGGIFLLLVDNVSRSLTTAGIPIGILTSFIGAPFFLRMITGRRDHYEH